MSYKNNMMIINAGSHIAKNNKNKKWTNTHKQAKLYADEWFEGMLKDGFTDIVMTDTKKETDGRWLFIFTHKITGVSVDLEVHGIDNIEEYKKEHIFSPRVYWNGSSTSTPELKDFTCKGYRPVITYEELQK